MNPPRYCPACDLMAPSPLFKQSFARIASVSILDGYRVVACEACGMTYADGIPDQAAFDAYYAHASKYEFSHQVGSESPYDNARLRIVADTIARLVPNKDARILDIGCSTGQLLRELRARGYTTLSGLDPSPACVEIVKQREGIAVQCGTIDTLAVGQFDLIIMVGVLEHLRDVQRLLYTVVRRRLAEGGQLYIEVPDAARFDVHPNAPFQEFSLEHINYFAAHSLTKALRFGGFDPWRMEMNDRVQSATVTMSNLSCLASIDPGPRPEWEKPVPPASREGIRRYVAQSVHAETAVLHRIDALVASQEPVVIWGVGTHLLRLFATTELSEANIVALLDANPAYWGMYVGGYGLGLEHKKTHLIHDPRQATLWQSPRILISSVPFEAEIRARIAGMHLPNAIDTL